MFKFILSVIFAFSIVISSSAFGLYVLTCPDREKIVVSSSKDNGVYKAKGNIEITWVFVFCSCLKPPTEE